MVHDVAKISLIYIAFDSQVTAENFISYYKTKFFRILVSAVKISQHAFSSAYRFVPKQDFSKPWTDIELYKKYGLSEKEISFIETTIKPMDEDISTNADVAVMTVLDDGITRYYGPEGNELDLETVGSWRIPFNGRENAAQICKDAIRAGAVAACAHDDLESGLIYFYVDGTSDDAQRTLLTWLRANDLLPREDDGSYTDIIYAYDIRSTDSSSPDAKLSEYIDL